MANDDRPIHRRRFFREGLRELLKPLAQAIEPLEQVTRQLGALEETAQRYSTPAPSPSTYSYSPEPSPGPYWLRPPGALEEQRYLESCSRCGECVRACPASAIRLDYSYTEGCGAPYILPDDAACVMCDGLECMNRCPTGALLPVPREQINMGLAVWHEDRCTRAAGSECTLCIEKCPMGDKAIVLTQTRIEVLQPGCTGCGVCQNVCPTNPKAIVVTPRSELEANEPKD